MNRLLATALTLLSTTAAAAEPSRLMLDLGSEADAAAEVKTLSAQTGLTLEVERESVLGWWLVRWKPSKAAAAVEQAADLLRELDLHVSVDRTLTAFAATNDPLVDSQWAVDTLSLPGAWARSTGSGVRIGIVDSGILAHEDLVGRVLPGFDFVSDPQVAADGNGRDADPTDPGDGGRCGDRVVPDSWHGTGVAGIAAAGTGNGLGIAGTAPDAEIQMARALGRCGGSTVDILEAAYWLAGGEVPGVSDNPTPVDVLNLSLGGPGVCQAIEADVYSALAGAGIVTVVAAGNEATDTAQVTPASCPGVLTVAASDHQDILSSYSNYGAEVDIVAPGGDAAYYGVAEADVMTLSGPGPDAYGFTAGTSFSAPYVAGIAAQLLAVDPTLGLAGVRGLLQGTGDPAQCPGAQDLVPCHVPRADAAAALQALAAGGVAPTPTPPATPPEPGVLSCGTVLTGATADLAVAELVVPGGEILIELAWPGGADLDLYLTDPSGERVLAASEGDVGSYEAIGGELAAGRYLVGVRAFAGSATFELGLSCAEAPGAAPIGEGAFTASGCDQTGGRTAGGLALLCMLGLRRRR